MRRSNSELGLQRVVVRTVGVIAVVECRKLRVGHDEILGKQSARAQRAAVNDLTGWLDGTNICCVQSASDIGKVPVRDGASEGRIAAQCLRSREIPAHNAA